MTDEETQEEVQEETTEEPKEEETEEKPEEETVEEQPVEETTEQPQDEIPAEQMGDPRYQTLKTEEIKYGTNNFIEVARKKVDDAEFISLSKGYYTKRGTRRYKNGLGFPDQDDIKKFLVEKLQNI